ncbi:filamentous hemagglutinin N-terminal domain-containing protein [Variovorax terrae]|uniref:Filamentous hemagglutinin N-terminal domain-containing protein n=1 Tax=Variovorax terrae TaxID=2923278 RepID=A0A9X2AM79_9BURK|nr:filamentous hemagglutinin N-terminal domain-containing protein [Variovorax terrae]MCJ0763428.1 filamentous hemagglutinin N-terminal domain-containing protein [Variovorax terrae]
MNHIYRLVWNGTTQTWAAVAETATGRGRHGTVGPRLRRALARAARTALQALPVAGIGLSALAQTVTLAPGQQGRAFVSPNGTTVVDIATANAAGVSHNKFMQYNVGAQGLVLNNTTSNGALSNASQLAGSVLANMSSTRAANVIVNEVVSANRSVLAGFTEVAGQRADVIVANPYGITCSGCGFINTDRVTLSTGTPRWAASGALDGFDVRQGDILVNGAGLNATAQQILDLVTRSVKLDGAVNAQDLGVFAGTGAWNYASRSAGAAGAGTGAAPAYAIDASALGAMYANQIKLVANEAGVGVRLLGDVAAQVKDVTISAAGQVELRNHLSARGSVQVASAGSLIASGATIGAGQTLSLSGRSVTLSDGAYVESAGPLQVTSSGSLNINNAGLRSGQGLSLSGADLSLSNGAYLDVGGRLQATASSGALTLSNSGVKAKGDITLAATQGNLSLTTGSGQGVQSTAGTLSLQAGGNLALAGTLSADVGNVKLQSGAALSNSGTVQAGGTLDAQAATTLGNQGTLLAKGALTAKAGTAFTNSGTVQGATLGAQAATLSNSGTLMSTQGVATLGVTTQFTNTGLAQAQTDLTVTTGTSGSVTNQGKLLSGGALKLTAGTLDNQSAGVVLAKGALQLTTQALLGNAGTAQGTTLAVQAGAVDNSGKLLSTQGGAALTVTGQLGNSGKLQGATSLDLSAQTLDNAADILSANGTSTVTVTGALTNRAGANLAANGAMTLQAGTLDNAGLLGATGNLNAQSSGALTNEATGTLQAQGNLTLGAGAAFDNQGSVQAGGSGQVTATGLSNAVNAELRAASGLTVALGAGGLDNSGLLKAGLGTPGDTTRLTLTSQGGDLVNQTTGRLEAGSLALTADNLNNLGSLTAGAGGSTLQLGGGFDNASGATATLGASGSSSQVTAGRVGNLGTLATAGDLLFNLAGDMTNGSAANSTASVATGGALTFRGRYEGLGYSVTNYGKIDAQGALAFGGFAPRLSGDPIYIPGVSPCTESYCPSGRLGSLNVYGSLHGGTVDLATRALTMGAAAEIVSQRGMTITTDTLSMAQAPDPLYPGQVITSRIMGAMAATGLPADAGQYQVKVASLDRLGVVGLLYSRDDLDVQAPDILVSGTGAIAALNNLHLAATRGTLDLSTPMSGSTGTPPIGPSTTPGFLTNFGTLYAGNTLSARVNGTLTNAVQITTDGSGMRTLGARGSIAAGQNISLVANTFINNSDVNSEGDLQVVATSLRNEVQGGDKRVYSYTFDPNWINQAPPHVKRGDLPNQFGNWTRSGSDWDDNDKGGNLDVATNYIARYTETLKFAAGTEPLYYPTLTAAHNAKLYFNNGKNLGGLVQGVDSVLMQGFAARSSGTAVLPGVTDDAGRVLVAPQAGDSDMAVFTNDSLAQVTVQKHVSQTMTMKYTAVGPDIDTYWNWCHFGSDAVCTQDGRGTVVPTHVVDSVQAVLPTGYSGARIYTANLSGSGFTLYNEGSSTSATYERGDSTIAPSSTPPDMTSRSGRNLSLISSTTLLTPGSKPVPVPGPAQSSVLPGDGTQTGWTPVSLTIQPTSANGSSLQTGLTFGGIQVNLPASPNGLFVLARNPAAGYLIESNPLYRVGSTAVGSDYLRDRLGFSTDEAVLRLGDGSYESWLVQQQLISQTGSMLLKGYGSLDELMRGLMDNAGGQAKALGLVWGQALTPEQIAGLKSDIVWMVKTTLNGQEVLVPVVYLSQSTKDSIKKGAIIEADSGTLDVNGKANSGTISGVTVNNLGGGKAPDSLFGFGSGGSSAQNFNDQSFEIVKSYLMSAGGAAVGVSDVKGWLEKNKSNPDEIGKVLPFAYSRYMALSTGGGLVSANDKAFVEYVGNYAKQQRLDAIDKAIADYEAFKKSNNTSGKSGTLNSLFALPPPPPQWIIDEATQGVILSDAEKQRVGSMLISSGVNPIAIGSGATAAAAVAGGTAAGVAATQLGTTIAPFAITSGVRAGLTVAEASSSVFGASFAAGPIGIVAAALMIAGEAMAQLIQAETFIPDLKRERAKIEAASGSDVAFWLNQKGGAEQLFLSMAKMMGT